MTRTITSAADSISLTAPQQYSTKRIENLHLKNNKRLCNSLKLKNIFKEKSCIIQHSTMPPKKIRKIENQQTLGKFFGKSTSTKETLDVSDSEDGANTPKKERKFLPKWLKDYPWLRYDNSKGKGEDFVYCAICTEHEKPSGLHKRAESRNFQNSTFLRHIDTPHHKHAVQIPLELANKEKFEEKTQSTQDKAIVALLKIIHWMAMEDLPLSKFQSLLHLQQSLGVEDLKIFKELDKLQYDSYFTANELLNSLSKCVEQNIAEKILNSPVITILADESTDISNRKRLVLYIQIISNTMATETFYLCNVECTDSTGKGIADAILSELSAREIPLEKVMSLGTDGASVMTGKRNGAAALLRRMNPHMTNIHCIAHRLALCSSQASENITALKVHQQILTDLFYYFKGSSKRQSKLEEIQKILEEPILKIKEVHSVRWLSYFDALSTVYRSLESLLSYFAQIEQNKDPKAAGLKKKIASEKFISITYMMMDAMAPVTILSQFFQTEDIDVGLVQVKLNFCIQDLKKVKNLNSPYLKKLNDDLKSGFFKNEHKVTKPVFNLKTITEEFVDNLIENIENRFPENDLLYAFSVLSMRTLSFLSSEEQENYGNEEIDVLCKHYGEPKTLEWTENGAPEENLSSAKIDPEKTREWAEVKQTVLAMKYPRDKMKDLWTLIVGNHKDQFPNISLLAQLAMTSAVHTAGCERGFSVQNKILTKKKKQTEH